MTIETSDLSETERLLLIRVRRRPIVFTGAETDAERLAMLQLYTARLVTQASVWRKGVGRVMEWTITPAGKLAVGKLWS